MDIVEKFMTLPEIWERAADDLADQWRAKKDNTVYLLVIEENQIIGVMQLDGTTSVEITIHPYLLKNKRHKGREMMRLFFKMFLETDYYKVSSQIPDCFKSVYNFAIKLGFKLEGINRLSAIRKGQIRDQYIVGITREEVESIYG